MVDVYMMMIIPYQLSIKDEDHYFQSIAAESCHVLTPVTGIAIRAIGGQGLECSTIQ